MKKKACRQLCCFHYMNHHVLHPHDSVIHMSVTDLLTFVLGLSQHKCALKRRGSASMPSVLFNR